MATSILICCPKYGGCGHFGKSTQWDSESDYDHDALYCPDCLEDHAFQLTDENFNSLIEGIDEAKILLARALLDGYYGKEKRQ